MFSPAPQISGVSRGIQKGGRKDVCFPLLLVLIVYSNKELQSRRLLKSPCAARVAVFDRNPRKSPEPQRGNPILFS